MIYIEKCDAKSFSAGVGHKSIYGLRNRAYNAVSFSDLSHQVLCKSNNEHAALMMNCCFDVMSQICGDNPFGQGTPYYKVAKHVHWDSCVFTIEDWICVHHGILQGSYRKQIRELAKAFVVSVATESVSKQLRIRNFELSMQQGDLVCYCQKSIDNNPLRSVRIKLKYIVTPAEFFADVGHELPPQISLDYFADLLRDKRGLDFHKEAYYGKKTTGLGKP